jgi:Tol biopolymer transport system component
LHGTDVTKLTDFPDDGAFTPAWSPDGTKIVFAGQALGSARETYVMNAGGSGQRQLTFAGKVETTGS